MPNLEMLPAPGSPALGLLAWLLTYAVHSTLLGAGVWLATTLLRGHSVRETLWKAALVGGLLTTTLQMGLGVEPLGGRLALPVAAVDAVQDPASLPRAANEKYSPSLPASSPTGLLPAEAGGSPPPAGTPATALSPTRHGAASSGLHVDLATQISLLKGAPGITFPSLSWGHLMLLAWMAGAAFALMRLLRGRSRFLAGLGPRYPVVSGAVFQSLVRLRKRAGIKKPVHLTRSARLTSPVALGRHEICLPDRALIELNRRQQEGMLAHELAHLARRDPIWLVVSGVIESLFFFQPFNALGRRRLQESTEFMADEWAVQHTGRRLTLARSLAQVASWLEQKQQPAALAPMARLGSPLLRRIHQLLDEGQSAAAPHGPRLRFAAAILPLLAVASLAPAVSGGGTASEAPEADATRPVLAAAESGDRVVAPSPRVATRATAAVAPGYAYRVTSSTTAPRLSTGSTATVAPSSRSGYRVAGVGSAPLVASSRSRYVVGTGGVVSTAPVGLLTSGFMDDDGNPTPTRLKGKSNWVHNDDQRNFSMNVDGELHFSDDMNSIDSMSPGTTMTIREREDGNDRRLKVTADENGLPLYEYRVNGQEEPFEPGGRHFLEETLAELNERRAATYARQAELEVRRDEMMAQREEVRLNHQDLAREERELAREMVRQSEDMRRAMTRENMEMRREDRERSRAYLEATREMREAQRQEDMELRRQLRDEQGDLQREAADAFRYAEDLMREAEQADPEERDAAVEAARSAMEDIQRDVEAMQRDLEQRQMEYQQQREENSQLREEDLERLQREMEEVSFQRQQELQRNMEEQQRLYEDQRLEMERRRQDLHREFQERQQELHEEREGDGAPVAMAYPAPRDVVTAQPYPVPLPDPALPASMGQRAVVAPVPHVTPRPALAGPPLSPMPAPVVIPRADPVDRPDEAPPAPPAPRAWPDPPEPPAPQDGHDSGDVQDEPAPEPDRN